METINAPENFDFNVTKEFLVENIKQAYRNYRKSGPYTKDEKIKRQNKVYKLHFEYGYSARKISEIMKINRNTINGDIQYWYAKIAEKNNRDNSHNMIKRIIERLEIQRTRLREMLDKTDEFKQRITIEKLLLEVESKIQHTVMRDLSSEIQMYDQVMNSVNKIMEERKQDGRFITLFDTLNVSSQAHKKIQSIILEDRKKPKTIMN